MEAKFGRIAVVGERDISLGFKLVGIKDVFISEGKDAASTISKLMSSKEYDLIIASYRLKALMSANARHLAETATKPLVIFIPSEKVWHLVKLRQFVYLLPVARFGEHFHNLFRWLPGRLLVKTLLKQRCRHGPEAAVLAYISRISHFYHL